MIALTLKFFGRRKGSFLRLGILGYFLTALPSYAHEHDDPLPATVRLGQVSFPISCKAELEADFNRAVAFLHSFWLDEAERRFTRISIVDPNCAMAFWGIAMADFNQINGGPTPAAVTKAIQALARADAAHEKTPREAAYIRALHAFFDGYSEADFDVHAKRYSEAMQKVAARYPEDTEAEVFYALALINSQVPDDLDLANDRKAVAILDPLFKTHPNHPGIAHYIIHATDNPAMAQQGLEAARRYAVIAPAAPHALHMPSHIFARLGLWEDDIQSNLASKAASENPALHAGAENRLHAMEFLEYAYLQVGRDDDALAMVSEAASVRRSDVDLRYPTYYADVEARLPALYAIETGDWTMAAGLTPVAQGDWVSQGRILLANAVAAGHLHNARTGKAASERLESLTKDIAYLRAGSPRATLPDEIRSWARFAQGDTEGALDMLRVVADRQEQVGKGEMELPAREMLATMLSLEGRNAEALSAYQRSLFSDPNRFNALLGAGIAAEKLDERGIASDYYRTLLANCGAPTGQARRKLEHARAYLKGQ